MRIINNCEDILGLAPSFKVFLRDDSTLLGIQGHTYNITGASTINNCVVIGNLMHELQAFKTLEVGMAYGASTLVFCGTHAKLGLPNSAHISIDPFQLRDYGNCGILNVKASNLDNYLKVYYEPSCIALPSLLSKSNEYDLIYVDGSHLFENVFVDVYYALKLLRAGGVVLLDDSFDPHVRKVISFVRKNFSEYIQDLDLEPYRLPSQISLKYQVAKRLRRVQLTGFRLTKKIDRLYGTKFMEF